MSLLTIVCIALVASIIGLSESQCVSRIRQVVPVSSPASCGGSDDLTTIVQLAKALNEIENTSTSSCNCSNAALNVDGIISKLINALIVATVGNTNTSSASNMSGGLLNLGLGGQDILSLL